jgi:hypothetical protein
MKLTTAKELKALGWNWTMLSKLPRPDEVLRTGKNRVPCYAWTAASIDVARADPKWQEMAIKFGVHPDLVPKQD